MYIKESADGFGRGSIVIIVVNVLMIGLMTAGFIMDRSQRRRDAAKKPQEIEMEQDYQLAKMENSAEVKQVKVLSNVSGS